VTLADFGISLVLLLTPKLWNIWLCNLSILSIPDEGYSDHTRWRLFWAYLMKVILSIPDEGYSEHTWWRLFWAYLMKVILIIPDEGYSEHTWWRLFQKRVVRTKLDIYVFCCMTAEEKFWFSMIITPMINQRFVKRLFWLANILCITLATL
jgi:hypothetical protein